MIVSRHDLGKLNRWSSLRKNFLFLILVHDVNAFLPFEVKHLLLFLLGHHFGHLVLLHGRPCVVRQVVDYRLGPFFLGVLMILYGHICACIILIMLNLGFKLTHWI
jgi:hypothetical protein